jgi:hypothetical protein
VSSKKVYEIPLTAHAHKSHQGTNDILNSKGCLAHKVCYLTTGPTEI